MPQKPQQPQPYQASKGVSAKARFDAFSAAMTDPAAFMAARRIANSRGFTKGAGVGTLQTLNRAQLSPFFGTRLGASASDWARASGGSGAGASAPYSDPASGPLQGWTAPAQLRPSAYAAAPSAYAGAAAGPTGDRDVGGPVPGVRYCDPVPGATWPDGTEVCNRFHPGDPRWNWRPSFEGEQPPWEVARSAEPGTPYDNWNTERDGGQAQAKEQARVEEWQSRAQRELCGPQLRKYKIPLSAQGQRQKYGTTFGNLLRQLGSSSPQEVKKARMLLIAAIRQNPPRRYTAPDPFYARCDRQRKASAANRDYQAWARACQSDPGCTKRRQKYAQACSQARAALPDTDPRGSRWEEDNRKKGSAALAQEKQRLAAAGWTFDRRTDTWSHPVQGGVLEGCAPMREHWMQKGSNPRMWMTGAVEGAPRYPEGHTKAGQPVYARDVHTLPLDRKCRFKKSATLESEFIQNNFFNADGSRRSYEELLQERVITRGMIECVQVADEPRLKRGARPQLTAEQIDQYLKNSGGSWKKNGDGTRMTIRDIVPELLEAGVLSSEDVVLPTDADPVADAEARNFSTTLSVEASVPDQGDSGSEEARAVQVQGSPIPYYGSFPSQGAGTRFSPPRAGSTPLSVMGGVRAFPDRIDEPFDGAYDLPPNLSEGVPTVGASSIGEFTVSFMDGSESWPALR